MESSGLHQLQQIPGVGKSIARDMHNIGINSIDDLNGRRAEPLVLYFSDFNTTCLNWWMVTAHVEAKATGAVDKCCILLCWGQRKKKWNTG